MLSQTRGARNWRHIAWIGAILVLTVCVVSVLTNYDSAPALRHDVSLTPTQRRQQYDTKWNVDSGRFKWSKLGPGQTLVRDDVYKGTIVEHNWVSGYPFFIKIGDNKNEPYCGGVLVTPNRAITAGHCCYPDKTVKVHTAVGETVTADTVLVGGYAFPIVQPQYSPVNDLCVLRLQQNSKIQAPTLPKIEDPPEVDYGKTQLRIVGTGLSFEAKDMNVDFKKVDYKMRTGQVALVCCSTEKAFDTKENKKDLNKLYSNKKLICVGDGPKGEIACAGESGSPLLSLWRKRLYGALSDGIHNVRPCASGPVYYTYLPGYADFLRKEGIKVNGK